jgi:hypothetical protein
MVILILSACRHRPDPDTEGFAVEGVLVLL